MMKTLADLAPLLAPKSIAIIGASDSAASVGGRVVRLLKKFQYPGDIWPVNPQRDEVAGLRCYRLDALPRPADLAVFAVSAQSTFESVRACSAAGIRHGIALASGFAEAGAAGIERQRQLVAICMEHDFSLCGPNCLGIVNTFQPMMASFSAALVEAGTIMQGNISMVSQSGSTAATTQALANRAGVGFRYLISTGNEAVLQTADYISALADDQDTRLIAVYLEGCNDGPRLIDAFTKARDAHKPVVVLKAGMSADSARAATAHTGVLAGEGRVWDAIFRESAVIPVKSQGELLDVCLYLSRSQSRVPAGRNVAIVATGGGYGVVCADLCATYKLNIPSLTASSEDKLRPLLPAMASIANPFDLTPQAINHPDWSPKFPKALDVIAADPNIDTIFFPLGAMGPPTADVIKAICELRARTDKAIALAWLFGSQAFFDQLADAGIHIFPESPAALRALDKIIAFRELREDASVPRQAAPASSFDWRLFVPAPAAGTVISEHECHRMLAAAGLPVAAGQLASSEQEAVSVARSIRYPAVMKGISPKVTHRAAAGLVALDVRADDEVRSEYRRLRQNAGKINVDLDGIYIQHMEEGSLELLLSSFRDPIFGIMITCGAGGNLAELIDDVALQRAPLDKYRATALLRRLRLIERAANIDQDADLGALADFVARFSRIAAAAPWRRFVLEVNPVKWQGTRVVAVDGLLLIEDP